MMWSRRLCSTL